MPFPVTAEEAVVSRALVAVVAAASWPTFAVAVAPIVQPAAMLVGAGQTAGPRWTVSAVAATAGVEPIVVATLEYDLVVVVAAGLAIVPRDQQWRDCHFQNQVGHQVVDARAAAAAVVATFSPAEE